MGGTDTHAINYLFDEKTAAEIHRSKHYQKLGLELSIEQQIIANSYHQK